MKIRLLKFDSFYPTEYLQSKQVEIVSQINDLSYDEYYDWLVSLRSYLSDFFTYPMNQNGWEAREFYGHDPILLEKLIKSNQISDISYANKFRYILSKFLSCKIKYLFDGSFINKLNLDKYFYIERYIKSYNPDILFLREPTGLDGSFFDRYKNKKFIVSLIGCQLNHTLNWNTFRSDLIITITKEYYDFFKAQGIDCVHFEYGVDSRVFESVKNEPKIHNCVFVGLLGSREQSQKSELMEFLASKNLLVWWGPMGAEIDLYPNLKEKWRGLTSGIDMYKIYRSSKIVVNDYVDTAMGQNVNLRSKEVLSVGSFLLTRGVAPSIDRFGSPVHGVYADKEDCVKKINYYLDNEIEREAIAYRGLQHSIEKYNYNVIVRHLMDEIEVKFNEWSKNKI